jgi:transcriptional regulator with XRE-family HTH domain
MLQKSLTKKTLELYRQRPRSMTKDRLAEELGISPSWVDQWSRGIIKNPSADRIQAIYEFLSGKKLEL